jgi:hypothetical protein
MSDRIDLGSCNFHLAVQIRRFLALRQAAEEDGHRAVPSDSSSSSYHSIGSDAEERHAPPGPPDDYRVACPTRQRFRRGAPFIPYPEYTYVGRDNRGIEHSGEQGPRMYVVNVNGSNRVYIVDRSIPGSNHLNTMDLLYCEQKEESGCDAIGYKFRCVIYLYGYHNHE